MTLDLSPDALDRRILAAARALAGLSQGELAKAAGLHLNALQRIEIGGNMRVSTLGKLLRALETCGVELLREADGSSSGVRFKAVVPTPESISVTGSDPGTRKRRSSAAKASRDTPEASEKSSRRQPTR